MKGEKPQNIMEWMMSERLYEEYLFFYILVILFWVAIGFFCFGFEVAGFSAKQNLLLNFILFLLLATLSAFPTFWYDLVFGKNARLNRRSRQINEKLAEITDERKREAIKIYLAQDGQLPPRKLQKYALVFLGWCILFELFLVNAWIKDMHLVWQPDWVNVIINWMRDNTADFSAKPIGKRRIFLAEYTEINDFGFAFKSTKEFLDSFLGESLLFFHFWRAFIFPFVLFFLCVLLWKPIDWLGFINLDPRYISGIKRMLFCILISFFTIFFFIFGGVLALFMDISDKMMVSMIMEKGKYLEVFWVNILFVFIIFGLKSFYCWLRFFVSFIQRR